MNTLELVPSDRLGLTELGKRLASDAGRERARNRYAVGVGVGLMLLDQEAKKLAKAGTPIPEEAPVVSKRAAAQAALNVLPEFDALAREAGVDL